MRSLSRNKWRSRIPALGLAAALTVHVAFAGPALAQADAANLFTYGLALDSLSAEQQDRVKAYQADPTAAEVTIVSINPQALKAADTANAMTLNVQGRAPVLLDNIRIEERAADKFSWFGTAAAGADRPAAEAILVVDGRDVVGTVRIGDQLYRIRPAGDNQALIRVDQGKFPEEHPPEYQQLERTPALPRPAPSDTGLADICPEYTAIIAYTAAAKTEAGNIDALIQLAVDETNQGYANGQVGTKIKLVHKYQTDYAESADMTTDRDRFRIPGDGFMDEVHGLRDTHAADVGLLITKSGNYCGIAAAILADAGTAFAVVGQNCATGYYSFAHEVGHLQGARHNPEADPTATPFAYGHGIYNEPGAWRTIMSYACPAGTCTRLNYWSNPNVMQGGVPMGTAATHDNHRVLNETSCTIAGFRGGAPVGVGPLAFGVLWSDGNKMSGTPNWTSTYNGTYRRYEIAITGENYYYTSYATAITPAGDARYCRSDSVGGKLLIYCYDHTGTAATSRVGFVTYKK